MNSNSNRKKPAVLVCWLFSENNDDEPCILIQVRDLNAFDKQHQLRVIAHANIGLCNYTNDALVSMTESLIESLALPSYALIIEAYKEQHDMLSQWLARNEALYYCFS